MSPTFDHLIRKLLYELVISGVLVERPTQILEDFLSSKHHPCFYFGTTCSRRQTQCLSRCRFSIRAAKAFLLPSVLLRKDLQNCYHSLLAEAQIFLVLFEDLMSWHIVSCWDGHSDHRLASARLGRRNSQNGWSRWRRTGPASSWPSVGSQQSEHA